MTRSITYSITYSIRLLYTLTLYVYSMIYSIIHFILFLELVKRIIYKDLEKYNVNNLLDFYSTIGFLGDLLKLNVLFFNLSKTVDFSLLS